MAHKQPDLPTRHVGRQGGAAEGPQAGRGGSSNSSNSSSPHQGAQWSNPLPLHKAIARAPVLIRLEEGHRGPLEELSLSAGDTMALEGVTEIRGRRVVMAHYASDLGPTGEKEEKEEGEEYEEVSRALLVLPYDSLPELDVRILEDSRGHAYTNFLDTHFPTCNWAGQQQELLEQMGDRTYINVGTIISKCHRPSQPSSDKELWTLPGKPNRRRPPPPPPGLEVGGHSRLPPPRPPRAALCRAASSGVEPERPPSYEAPGRPPPRPARRSADPPPPTGMVKLFDEEKDEEEEEEEEEEEVFAMPSLAEIFSGGSFFAAAAAADEDKPAEPGISLPEKAAAAKDKKKILALTDKMKSLGKKVYAGVSKTTARLSQASFSTRGGVSGVRTPRSASPVDKEAEDPDEDYTAIDESMMDANFDKLSPPVKAADRGKREKKQVKKDPKGKAEMASKPVVRVQPHTASSVPLTSRTTSSTAKQPTRGVARHPMMAPIPDSSGEDNYEVADDSAPKVVSFPLEKMTCSQLCVRLQQCGMQALAQTCLEKSLDGAFFCALTDDSLRRPPFSLDDFQVDTHLRMVKAGWVPK